jgi:hypothetical protein
LVLIRRQAGTADAQISPREGFPTVGEECFYAQAAYGSAKKGFTIKKRSKTLIVFT